MDRWPPPGEVKAGCPTEPLSVNLPPFLSRQRCRAVILPHCVVNGQGAGRHSLFNGIIANYAVSGSLRAFIASTCMEHSLSKAVLTALHCARQFHEPQG